MGVLDLLVPPACAGCRRYGTLLCDACLGSLSPLQDGDALFLAPAAGVLVGQQLEQAVAAFRHAAALRRILQRLKYGGASGVARALARAALPALDTLLADLAPDTPLVPVPVHLGRRRERGYNQAALLAGALADARGRRLVELLVRSRPTERQHHLDRSARLHNLRAAFALAPRHRAPPEVLLVDDILTTGATLEACAGILRAAGTQRVVGFAIAREV